MIRKKKRQKAKKRKILLMFAAIFALYFFVVPHFSGKVGELPEAVPAAASSTQQTIETTARNTSSEYLLLVNKGHSISADYEPKDLVMGSPRVKGANRYQKVRKVVASAFSKLSAAASKKGYTIKLTSGYRPYAYQKQLFEKYVNKDGRYSAEQYSAEPGHSEHQTGLCADVSSPSVNYNLVQAYGTTEEGKWLEKNAHKFGFIIRFPKGKEDITGYDYEPWHIRYVGKDAAKEIKKQNLTLEEYLGKV